MTRWPLILAGALAFAGLARAADPEAVERGKKALLGRSFSPPTITLDAYNQLWRQWGLDKKPAPEEYQRLFRERYGFHEAPYPNGSLPMGLREAPLPFSLTKKGLSLDCMLCHAGSIGGHTYIALGNTTPEFPRVFKDARPAHELSRHTPD